jgi:ABC-type dipeptide/oligopeptide/nickel transport system permease component
LVLTAVFFLLHLVPGDPTNLYDDQRVPQAQRAALRHAYGLDQPLLAQYLTWFGSALRGNLGVSLYQHRPALSAALDALPATLLLALSAVILEYGVGILLGVAAARRRGSGLDHAIRILSLLLYSIPVFWAGLMAILAFALWWPILPASGMHGADVGSSVGAQLADVARHLVLPAVVLGLTESGVRARFVRASLLEALGSDYIRTARAKGLRERRVIWVHGMRTALVPLVQILGLELPILLSGALVVEVVFSWPGLGRLCYLAIETRDYPLVLCITALAATLVLAGALAADLGAAALDPRMREG